jgi:hypothetical protein
MIGKVQPTPVIPAAPKWIWPSSVAKRVCRAITVAAFFAREPFVTWYKTGVVRVLLQTSRQRNPKIPDVPTLFELMEQYKTPEIKRRQVLVYLGVGGFGAWPILSTPGIPAEPWRLSGKGSAKP